MRCRHCGKPIKHWEGSVKFIHTNIRIKCDGEYSYQDDYLHVPHATPLEMNDILKLIKKEWQESPK